LVPNALKLIIELSSALAHSATETELVSHCSD
jgi:hypothetical protein